MLISFIYIIMKFNNFVITSKRRMGVSTIYRRYSVEGLMSKFFKYTNCLLQYTL